MNGRSRLDDHITTVRVLTLLLVLSFAAIPVRCDVSAAPHSIFDDPVAAGRHLAHQQADDQHSSAAHADGHRHLPSHAMDSEAASLASDRTDADAAPATTDLSSQTPVSGALDMPPALVPPASDALEQATDRQIVPAVLQERLPNGVTLAPVPPPPKSV